jgi:hypothetical protein
VLRHGRARPLLGEGGKDPISYGSTTLPWSVSPQPAATAIYAVTAAGARYAVTFMHAHHGASVNLETVVLGVRVAVRDPSLVDVLELSVSADRRSVAGSSLSVEGRVDGAGRRGRDRAAGGGAALAALPG